MARFDGEPHSAGRQFFINLADNLHLDHRGPGSREYGYTVFGQVVAGMDVVERIASVPTHRKAPFYGGVPKKPVILEAVRRVR